MHIREIFYAAVVLVLAGALWQHGYFGGWMMTFGGMIIAGLGVWKIIKHMDGIK